MNQTSDDLTKACDGVHVASIAMFQRAVQTPDKAADESLRAEAIARVMAKLTTAEIDLLMEAVAAKQREMMDDRESRILHFISKVVSFAMSPKPCAVKVMGVIYALDLPLHGGADMAASARRIGCTRASISNAAWNFARAANLQPSRWMRGVESTKASREARNKSLGTVAEETGSD